MTRERAIAIAQTLTVLMFMSLGTVWMKLALSDISPWTFAALSVFIGMVCLTIYTFFIRGERIPLVSPKHAEYEVPFSDRLVISVSLSDAGFRPILLQLDSGSDGPVLYAGKRDLEQSLLKRAKVQGPEVGEARRAFAVLPSQDMRIGSKIIRSVPFVTPVSASQNIPDREEDGILATVLFERVYINHTNRYVIFDPR